MRTTAIIGIVLVAAAATACGGSGGSSTAASSSAAAAAPAAAPDGATGTYTRQLTAGDIARTDGFRQEGTNQTAPVPGGLTLKLTNGTVSVTDDTGFEVAELSKLGQDASLEIQSYVDPFKRRASAAPRRRRTRATPGSSTARRSPCPRSRIRCADRNAMLTGSWRRASS